MRSLRPRYVRACVVGNLSYTKKEEKIVPVCDGVVVDETFFAQHGLFFLQPKQASFRRKGGRTRTYAGKKPARAVHSVEEWLEAAGDERPSSRDF